MDNEKQFISNNEELIKKVVLLQDSKNTLMEYVVGIDDETEKLLGHLNEWELMTIWHEIIGREAHNQVDKSCSIE